MNVYDSGIVCFFVGLIVGAVGGGMAGAYLFGRIQEWWGERHWKLMRTPGTPEYAENQQILAAAARMEEKDLEAKVMKILGKHSTECPR
jgi:hypothetical protein